MTALDALRVSLAGVNAHFVASQFGEPKSMGKTAEKLELEFGQGRAPDPELVLKTLRSFIQTGSLDGYRDIKSACYGLLVPVQGSKPLANSPQSTNALLGIVDRYKNDAKKLKRCFQGLLSAYMALDGCDPKSELHPQWKALRHHLSMWLPTLHSISPKPDWLNAAVEHQNLLGENPTKRYGAAILRGDSADFDSVCDRLSIGQHSWVRRRVVISSIEAAASQGDSGFLSHLDRLIAILIRNAGISSEGAAKLLNRYAQQAATPEHMALRAFAIDAFGNPLITANRQRWFEVSPKALEMVSDWLKGFLIDRFFELLSHDGRTDKRRPKFWKRHSGSIENMWFILGSSAMSSWNDDFRKLRETMGNHCLSLEGTTTGNNAFVMKVGKVYAVEFSETGNAAYLYGEDDLPFDMARRSQHVTRLKNKTRGKDLHHRDGHQSWERRFSEALAEHGVYADDGMQARRPRASLQLRRSLSEVHTPSEVRQLVKRFCNERGLRYDHAPSGRLVVYADSSNPSISGKLEQWGFTFDATYARWIENP